MPHSSFAARGPQPSRSIRARGRPEPTGASLKFVSGKGACPLLGRFTNKNPFVRPASGHPSESASEPASAPHIEFPALHRACPAFRLLPCSTRLRLEVRIRLDCGFQKHTNRTNPKRRPRKIRYAQPLACQGAEWPLGRIFYPTNVGVTEGLDCSQRSKAPLGLVLAERFRRAEPSPHRSGRPGELTASLENDRPAFMGPGVL
jgi:hypothetical protein